MTPVTLPAAAFAQRLRGAETGIAASPDPGSFLREVRDKAPWYSDLLRGLRSNVAPRWRAVIGRMSEDGASLPVAARRGGAGAKVSRGEHQGAIRISDEAHAG